MTHPVLSNPLRPAILAAARSSRVRRLVTTAPPTRRLVDRFVAGDSLPAALAVAEGLLASGRAVSIDHLGEDTLDPDQARVVVDEYRALLAGLGAVRERASTVFGGDPAVEVSVKLTALGLSLGADGPRIALDRARAICSAADTAGVWVTVDAEDHTVTDDTLQIVRELRRDHPWVGAVLQAYLYRTEQDCRDLAGAGSRVRLCKGAYDEPAAVAYRDRADVDESYRRCLRILVKGDGYPMVASHDPAMIALTDALCSEAGRGPDRFEHQMLFGIRDREQLRLAGAGRRMRVYVPYGSQWYGYLMRRIAERPSNLRFFVRSVLGRD
ncbi:MAG: proline dehydrogenase [Rhodococcus sp.]|uniref:proline dehydrogenase family protein n=1 Tax=Rhodococcus sp. TaxID=1831 RepID=UPI0016A4EA22|nr:proline dehydrogenase family protein [Rhodococcus sp. (in: high G+C Gram-positive bacteria)]NLV80645.1 proline dehydrogenase [Rhodococcus sp. (in: high G+C Gram-positive bacteria)]